MKLASIRSQLVIGLTLVCCVFAASGAYAAEAKSSTPESLAKHPLTVEAVPALTREHEIDLRGRAAPQQQVSIAGGAAPVHTCADSHGRFSVEVRLMSDQSNTLQISVANPSAMVSVTITQDRTAPQIVVESPADRALLYNSPVHLTGQVTDSLSGISSVSCRHSAATVTGTQFSCDVPISDTGAHHIKVWSSDRAGNVAVVHRRVVLGPQLPGGDAHAMAVSADVNGDRQIDVVRTDFASGEVSIQLGNGDGTFQPEKRVPVGPYPSSVALADINRDGILDLITTHYTTGEVAIQYGQPDGSYVAGPHISVGAFPSAIAVADIDKDGKPDLITTHMHRDKVRVHLARADGTFDTKDSVKVGDGPVALAVGDLHRDGKLDVVVANYTSNDVSLLRGRGDGRFHSERRIDLNPSANGPTAILLTDLDRDGVLDIATANFGSSDVTVLRGKGQGHFNPAQSVAVRPQPIALAALEVTGDDTLDLVTANLGSGDLSVLPGQASGAFGAIEPLRSAALAIRTMPLRLQVDIVLPDPAAAPVVLGANMPSAFSIPARAPAAGLPEPMDRIGMSFGNGTSDLKTLLGPNGMAYTPLVTMSRAGVKWIRLEGDANYFLPGSIMTFQSISAFVDDLIAHGFSVHIVVSDIRWWPPSSVFYPNDFPNDQFLAGFAQFATDLARATHRPGRVVYEVWNEPNLWVFWPQRPGVNEAAQYARLLARTTEAIHTAAPGSVVIAGGILSYGVTASGGSYVTDLLTEYNRLLVNRPLALVDRFALHPYPADWDVLGLFKFDLKKGGMGALPVNVTELGGFSGTREWVGTWNANSLLRLVEEDIPYVNLWGALSAPPPETLGGFMDVAQSQFSSCTASVYGALANTPGFMCHPSMYMLRTFDRVAHGRTYQGAMFDARTNSLPGWLPGDPFSGVRELKFESADDIVIAAYTIDRGRAGVLGSGRVYPISFPEKPIFVSSYSGQDILPLDAGGLYNISHDGGPVYFFFSKSGQPPAHTVNGHALCADGSPPLRGRLQLWHTAWPTPGPSNSLDWRTPGVSDAGTLTAVSDQMPLFVSNMYVYAEVADGSGRVLDVRSSAQTGGGPSAPTVTVGTQFNPPTQMVRLDGPSAGSGVYQVDYLALPEWCTP